MAQNHPISLFPQRPNEASPHWVSALGAWAVEAYQFSRRFFRTLTRSLLPSGQASRSARAVSTRILFRQIFFTGFEALPLISIIAVLVGATIVLQTQLVAAVPADLVGSVLVAVVLREVAPLTTAILVAGRSGTAVATELGNMQVNDEILGLRSMGIDPYRFVVRPRLIGIVVSVLILTVYFGAMAIVGGYVATMALGAGSFDAIRAGFKAALLPGDFPLFLLKGTGLGVVVGWLCCHFGLEVGASPTEVPRRASQAVVLGMLACVVLNTVVAIGFYSLVGPQVR